jgi:hypothetical protein
VRVIMESGQEGAWRYQINLKLQWEENQQTILDLILGDYYR